MFATIPRIASAAVGLVGLVVLAGWLLDLRILKSVLPGLPVMVPNTALAFVLASASLWLGLESGHGRWSRAARSCAALVAALGALTLLQYAAGFNLGLDRLLIGDAGDAETSTFPGRMSPHTALSFLLSGIALAAPSPQGGRGVKLSQALALASGLVALLALVGYIYSTTFLYSITPQTGMAVHTALNFLVLNAAILLLHPRSGPVAVFTSSGAGGVVARPLLAAAVAVPLLLGWLTALGQRAGLYEQPLGSSLLVVGSVVVFSGLVWHASRLLERVDESRRRAEDARAQLLKRLVVAQEEERARLSRELHDKMGQHLSALALNLGLHRMEARTTQAAEAQLERLSELAERLSQEVRDLAWELRPPELDDLGLKDALANYAEMWSRRTNVPVDFVVAGNAGGRLAPEAETAFYRVVQEALTNVSKHARASGVTILLERTPGQVVVVVEDDGRGFNADALDDGPKGRRGLGLLGMKERMELAGGALSMESAPGAGTTLVARVPVSGDRAEEA